MKMLPLYLTFLTLCCLLVFSNAAPAAASAAAAELGQLHVRIKNDLSDSMKIKVHCSAGDQSLGTQTIVKGMAIEWKVEPAQAKTKEPYYCDVEWNETEGFHFEAFSDASKKEQKCLSYCSWHITEEGPLLQNQKTGVWETMPFRPLPGLKVEADKNMGLNGINETYYHINHFEHKCICYPPKH